MKRVLCLPLVMFALIFMAAPPVSAMDFGSPEASMVSQHDTDTAPGVPIDGDEDFPLFAAVDTYLGNEKTHNRFDFVTEHRNIAIFSNAQGGGFILAHGSKSDANR